MRRDSYGPVPSPKRIKTKADNSTGWKGRKLHLFFVFLCRTYVIFTRVCRLLFFFSPQVEVFSMGQDTDPVDITKAGLEHAKEKGYDTVIIDTAGRQVVDDNLMVELKNIRVRAYSVTCYNCSNEDYEEQ